MAKVVQDITDPVAVFLQRHGLTRGTRVSDVFHAVRKIPYGSRGTRDLQQVVARNEGSCSGKHILLRDCLRRLGHHAEIETIRGDFTSRLPVLDTMGEALKHACRVGGITDFHHYVIWNGPHGEQRLDATWSDGPIAYGLTGNESWSGVGDTELALIPDEILGRVEDVPEYKKQLIATLSPDCQQRRLAFLSLLTEWVETTHKKGEE